jgi:hypothetical protein
MAEVNRSKLIRLATKRQKAGVQTPAFSFVQSSLAVDPVMRHIDGHASPICVVLFIVLSSAGRQRRAGGGF